MNETLKEKNTREYLIFFKSYLIISIFSITNLVITLFVSKGPFWSFVTALFAFMVWSWTYSIEKIYPFIYHRLYSFENKFYKYCVESSLSKYLSGLIPFIILLGAWQINNVIKIVLAIVLVIFMYYSKHFSDSVEKKLQYNKFDYKILEEKISDGVFKPKQIMYEEHFDEDYTTFGGLYEYRYYRSEDKPIFVVITQVENYTLTGEKIRHTLSMEHYDDTYRTKFYQSNVFLKDYIALFGVTHTKADGTKRIEFTSSNNFDLKGKISGKNTF